jgi:drug/metabolite transporter (DMT)-like permease
VPVFAVVFSVVLLGERPVVASLLGGMLVVCGVYLANRPSASPSSPATSPRRRRL